MPVLEVDRLVKSYGGMRAVDELSFSVDVGEILVILGGSGCGKTTTLRCIAGLESVTDGAILLDGKVVSSRNVHVPPERRGVGMVFQSYALWPHKTVHQNVSYGLERRGLAKSEIRQRVERALGEVGLSDYANRYPGTLSGGQQQRVALARSAALEPKLLLLDEPLSNLDAKLRERMREDLREMINTLRMTAVHITHDQAEAMALADAIVCLKDGRAEQTGAPRELYRKPRTRFVADFIGSCNLLEADFLEPAQNSTQAWFQCQPGPRLLVAGGDEPASRRATLAIRPEAVEFVAPEPGDGAVHPARVLRAAFLGSHVEYSLDVGGARLRAASRRDICENSECHVRIDPEEIVRLRAAAAGDQACRL